MVVLEEGKLSTTILRDSLLGRRCNARVSSEHRECTGCVTPLSVLREGLVLFLLSWVSGVEFSAFCVVLSLWLLCRSLLSVPSLSSLSCTIFSSCILSLLSLSCLSRSVRFLPFPSPALLHPCRRSFCLFVSSLCLLCTIPYFCFSLVFFPASFVSVLHSALPVLEECSVLCTLLLLCSSSCRMFMLLFWFFSALYSILPIDPSVFLSFFCCILVSFFPLCLVFSSSLLVFFLFFSVLGCGLCFCLLLFCSPLSLFLSLVLLLFVLYSFSCSFLLFSSLVRFLLLCALRWSLPWTLLCVLCLVSSCSCSWIDGSAGRREALDNDPSGFALRKKVQCTSFLWA